MTPVAPDAAWNRLLALAQRPGATAIRSLFSRDAARFEKFHWQACDMLLDLSKTAIDDAAMQALLGLAEATGVMAARDAMAAGERVNNTEDRAVLHMALRAPPGAGFKARRADGGVDDASADVDATMAAMERFTRAVHAGEIRSATGETFTDVINIGIGGSDLGPFMASRAMWHEGSPMRPLYLANADAHNWELIRPRLNPGRTLVLIASKTFTTAETMANARVVRGWLEQTLGTEGMRQHLVALSTNHKATAEFGVPSDRVFGFHDWVGGRFSLWSAIGLSIALGCGWDDFIRLLAGARAMDEHFLSAPPAANLPLLLALTTVWHVNGLGLDNHAILPYDHRLSRFPAHLQQLEMESLGKRVTKGGLPVKHLTGPVIFGEPGTNAQHSFMQLLHQGTTPVPADFVLIANPSHPYAGNHRLLLANGLAQAEALLRGRGEDEVRAEMTAAGKSAEDVERLLPHRVFPGDRPSTTLLLPRLDPQMLGQIVALYEHKVFCLGVLWDVDAFDQWGVELGKQLSTSILPELLPEGRVGAHDPSTAGLIGQLRAWQGLDN
ncbi:glucose-6-phosphate isomerase [Roseomonas haemaphysalidis]|uniref:Glucose-6-phosphate isomerase n=1 Tax=Roseomonas haemaphysalidis TaxID=2768162 RepID=A0ABS3KN27_9PROT|nr:glucose-6-phosphate isomerase [Roseomonas haemaphysalidis]MBO1078851.1 glucose-6-phosphate isomerase [Roseomonas haemaphysalidis]